MSHRPVDRSVYASDASRFRPDLHRFRCARGGSVRRRQTWTRARRGMRAKRTAASFPAADEDYFQRHGRRHPADPEEIQGRNMWMVWTGGNDRFWDTITRQQPRHARLPEDAVVAPGPALQPRQPLPHSRPGQRALLPKATGPDPNRYGLWLDMRDPDCPPDPFANAKKYPGVAIGARGKTVPVGSYYGEPTGIVGLRLFPNPDFDEDAREEVGLGALLPRPRLLLPTRSGEAVSRRHVVRLLPRRAESDQAAGRSREPEVGEPQLERRRAVLLGGPHLQLAERQQPAQLLLPAAAHVAARHARHLARLDRQHQQPADDERGLLPRPAHGAGAEVGQGDARRRRR